MAPKRKTKAGPAAEEEEKEPVVKLTKEEKKEKAKAEKKAKEEAEKAAKKEAERLKKEEEDRIAKEEAEKLAAEERAAAIVKFEEAQEILSKAKGVNDVKQLKEAKSVGDSAVAALTACIDDEAPKEGDEAFKVALKAAAELANRHGEKAADIEAKDKAAAAAKAAADKEAADKIAVVRAIMARVPLNIGPAEFKETLDASKKDGCDKKVTGEADQVFAQLEAFFKSIKEAILSLDDATRKGLNDPGGLEGAITRMANGASKAIAGEQALQVVKLYSEPDKEAKINVDKLGAAIEDAKTKGVADSAPDMKVAGEKLKKATAFQADAAEKAKKAKKKPDPPPDVPPIPELGAEVKAQLEKIGKSVEAANKKLREAKAIKGLKDNSEAAKLTAEVLQDVGERGKGELHPNMKALKGAIAEAADAGVDESLVAAAKAAMDAATAARATARCAKHKEILLKLNEPKEICPVADCPKDGCLDLKDIQEKFDSASSEGGVDATTLETIKTRIEDAHRELADRVLAPLVVADPVNNIDLIEPLGKAIKEGDNRKVAEARMAPAKAKLKMLEGVRDRRQEAKKTLTNVQRPKPVKADVKKVEAAIQEAIDAELGMQTEIKILQGCENMVKEAQEWLVMVKKTQAVVNATMPEVEKIDIPLLTKVLDDCDIATLRKEEGVVASKQKVVDDLKFRLETLEDTQAKKEQMKERISAIQIPAEKRKTKIRDDLAEKDTELVWNRTSVVRNVREEEAILDSGPGAEEQSEMDALKEKLEAAEKDLEEATTKLTELAERIGVAQEVIQAGKAKLWAAEELVKLRDAIRVHPMALDSATLELRCKEAERALVPRKYIEQAQQIGRNAHDYMRKRIRVVESMQLKCDETPGPDQKEVGKLVEALIKLVKEAEEVLVEEKHIVKVEERLVTLSIYMERLVEAQGGKANQEACSVM